MRLPRGATGFWHASDPPAGMTNLRELTRVIHDAARRTGGQVQGVVSADPGRSFHAFVLAYPDRRLIAVGHVLLPLLALAQPPGEDAVLSFVDDAAVVRSLAVYEPYRLMCPAELSMPVARADLSDLATAEVDQIRYWNPATVGDLLFNSWD